MFGCPVSGYSAPSTVGNQSAWALLDTGSSTYGVASAGCTTLCNGVSGRYKPGATATVTDAPIEADYGIGMWTGTIVQDTVSLVGGTSAHVAFGEITNQTDFFHTNGCALGAQQPVNNQAIMGLAGPNLLLPNTTSYFQAVKNSLYDPGYSFGMCDVNGLFFLGGYPTNYLSGDLIVTPMVASSNYLAVAMLGINIGSTSVGMNYTDFGAAIVDTGTTDMILPSRPYKAVTAAIVAQSHGVLTQSFFDRQLCNVLAPNTTEASVDKLLPPMTFNLLNPQYPNGSTYYTLTKTATASYAQLMPDAQGNQNLCPMLTNASGTPQTMLGATMMRGALVYFDFKTNSIGFASSTGICS